MRALIFVNFYWFSKTDSRELITNLFSLFLIFYLHMYSTRSSHRRCSVKKGVLRNLTKFTGKHLHQSLFFNKVAGLRPPTWLKNRLWRRCFPVNFTNFVRTPFLTEHLWTTASEDLVSYHMVFLGNNSEIVQLFQE